MKARLAGAVASLVGVFFVVRTMANHWEATRGAMARARPGWLALGLLLAMAAMVAIALPWRSAQRLVGPALSRFDTLTLYFEGELGKYVPGAVWATIGRAELARDRGIPRLAAYAGVGLSLVGLWLGCAVVAGATLLLAGDASAGSRALVVLVLPVGVVLLHPRVLAAVLRRLHRAEEGSVAPPSWRDASRLIALYVPGWVAIALATLSIARALTTELDVVRLLLATTISWLAGFLAVGAPGGLGVREATFVALAPGLSSGAAVAVAVLARMAFITADTAGAGVAHLARSIERRRRHDAG